MTAFKAALAALGMTILAGASANAASFSAHRGINLDQWTTWPDEAHWADPGVLDPFPEWRKKVGPAQLKALKEAGFDFVRMPVDPAVFLSDSDAGLHDALYGEVLDAAHAVNAAGLKAIVDLHLIASDVRTVGMANVMAEPERFEAYLETVRRMAKTLAGEDPGLVALELMNEPAAECEAGKGDWPDQLRRLYAAARSSATRLTLVLTGGCAGNADGLVALDPAAVPDDNVLWSFHSYAPFLLTHQGATWAGDFIPYVTGIPYPPYAAPKPELDAAMEKVRARISDEAPYFRRSGLLSYLDEQIAEVGTKEQLAAQLAAPFDTVDRWAKAHGIKPENILLGEFGMIRQEWEKPFVMPGPWRAAYAGDVIGLAEQRGYAWSIWSYGGAFGVVEEFEGRKAEPDVLDVVRGLPAR